MENRGRIIETALALFSERGYDTVGVQEICLRAGVSKPTLYHYFSSKRGLLGAVLDEVVEDLESRIRPALDYRGDLPRTLEQVTDGFLTFTEDRPAVTRLILSLQYAPRRSEAREVVAPYFEDLFARLSAMFAAAAEDHGNMRGREEPYAVSFLGTVFTYAFLLLEGRVDHDDGLAFRVMHQFSHGIYS